VPLDEPFEKGAFFRVADDGALRPLVAFQFNPGEVERRQRWDETLDDVRETIRLTLEFHAGGAGANEDPRLAEVYPRLAALEEALAAHVPGHSPPVNRRPRRGGGDYLVFRWGEREIPARLDALVIRETAFDRALAPTRASVDVALCVLAQAEARRLPGAAERLKAYHRHRSRAAGRAPTRPPG
jgi:hypothetical protein